MFTKVIGGVFDIASLKRAVLDITTEFVESQTRFPAKTVSRPVTNMRPSSTSNGQLESATKARRNSYNTKNGEINANGTAISKEVSKKVCKWHFDTLQVRSGLKSETSHGQCSLSIYSSASFRLKASKTIEDAYSFSDGPRSQFYMYIRLSNESFSTYFNELDANKTVKPSNVGFENRMAALKLSKDAPSFSSGAAAIFTVAESLVTVGDNAVIMDTNDLKKVEPAIDERIKFVFTETFSNSKFAVADLKGLSVLTSRAKIPLIVDATFSAAGFFCQPAKFGVDIVIDSVTKWIGGHGTTLGGVVIETGVSDWQSNAACYTHLHAKRGRIIQLHGTILGHQEQ
ncbi:plp-dependent transferase [Fusarium beomiforme]|uniref:Plp-dependent transferase n=1 Tax=Fusarium beomiforme TaxID=44412 RepID=A0A9P5AS30_9HYPO|nr:plp-dependent transferase [Fusarium beomiforme]